MSPINRRRFLADCANVAAGICLLPELPVGREDSHPSVVFPTAPRDRVAVAAYPFREFIIGWKGSEGTRSTVAEGQRIELKNFAAHIAEKFNVHHIEPWGPLFPSTSPAYMEEFRAAVDKVHSSVVDIAVDERYSQYALDSEERERALAYSKTWVDVGAVLGSPSIRTHIQEAKDSKPDVARAAATLSRVAEYGARKNVVIHLENDDPVSEDPFFIAQIIDKVNSPWLRALPDFGNSLAAHDGAFNDRALQTMFAHAYGICHVKDGEIDEHGKAVHVDLTRTFAILNQSGYKGYCSIEYDAPGDPYKTTAELVEKTIALLS